MKTAWDYTDLAKSYVKRPPYSSAAVDRMCACAGVENGVSRACDIGAGTGILTRMLLDRCLTVTAVEPNDAMRAIGKEMTKFLGAAWHEGVAEATGMPDDEFDLVTFGSSFNTTDRQAALRETARILKPHGWFACMWNHRDLDDPVQKEVEDCIKSHIPEYGYGTRREDQTDVIRSSGLFEQPVFIEERHTVEIPKDDYMEAWRSHATLQRQAGEAFGTVIAAIADLLDDTEILSVPYTTRLWMARAIS